MKKIVSTLMAVSMLLSAHGTFAYDLKQKDDFEPQTIRDGLVVSIPQYLVDGDAVTDLSTAAGKSVKSAVTVKDYANVNTNATIVVALYDADKSLVDVSRNTVTLDAKGSAKTFAASVDVPGDVSDITGYSIKTMVWSDMNTMLPYVQYFNFPNGTVNSDWTLNGWSVSRDMNHSEARDNANEFSALVSKSENAKASKIFEVEPGSTSIVSFMAKSDDYTNSSFECNIYGEDNTLLGTYLVTANDAQNYWYRNYYRSFAVPFNAGTNKNVKVEFVNKGTAAAYVDYVNVTDNLIVNGDFDRNTVIYGGAPEWYWGQNGNTVASTETDSDVKVQGHSSLKVTFDNASFPMLDQTVKSHIIEKAGTGTYVFSGYIKRENLNTNGASATKVFPRLLAGNNCLSGTEYVSDLLSIYGNDADSKDWHYFSVETDINTIQDITARLYFTNSSNIIHVDNLRLVKKTNLISNGDFENGSTKGLSVTGSGKSKADIINSNTYDGRCSFRMDRSSGGDKFDSLQYEVGNTLKANGTGVYHISLWVRSANGAVPRVRVTANYNSAENTTIDETFYSGDAKPGITDWQYIQGDVTVKNVDDIKNAYLTIFATADTNGSVDDYFVDNISFSKTANISEE